MKANKMNLSTIDPSTTLMQAIANGLTVGDLNSYIEAKFIEKVAPMIDEIPYREAMRLYGKEQRAFAYQKFTAKKPYEGAPRKYWIYSRAEIEKRIKSHGRKK